MVGGERGLWLERSMVDVVKVGVMLVATERCGLSYESEAE